jgi:hypothetical protein
MTKDLYLVIFKYYLNFIKYYYLLQILYSLQDRKDKFMGCELWMYPCISHSHGVFKEQRIGLIKPRNHI